METKLERIAEVAKAKPNERFTSLIHLINKEPLIQCHNEMNVRKASDNIIDKKNIEYVVYTDIKGFFDNVSHEWMMQSVFMKP